MGHQIEEVESLVQLIPAGVQQGPGESPGLVEIGLVIHLIGQGLIKHVAVNFVGNHAVGVGPHRPGVFLWRVMQGAHQLMTMQPVFASNQEIGVSHGAQLRRGVALGEHAALKGKKGDLRLGELLLQLCQVLLPGNGVSGFRHKSGVQLLQNGLKRGNPG